MDTVTGWRKLESDPLIAVYAYSFGPSTVNALAVGIGDGVMIVSPPCRVDESVFSAAAELGHVRALVAPNAFHTLGLAAWKRRFPDAVVFAPAQSIARVSARSGVSGIRPLADAARVCSDRVTLIDMPHYKTGEALVRIRAPRGLVWYVTDVILNLPKIPAHPVAWLAFGLSGSAPGLRLHRVAPLVMVRDRAALWRWLRSEIELEPPSLLIPAHGEIVDLAATPGRLAAIF